MGVIYLACALSKWCTVFKYYFFYFFHKLVLSLLLHFFQPIILPLHLVLIHPGIVTVPLKSIYVSLESHKVDLSIKLLNLSWLSFLYIPRYSSFISTKFLGLNIDVWFDCLTSLLLFHIPLLYYYIYLRSLQFY